MRVTVFGYGIAAHAAVVELLRVPGLIVSMRYLVGAVQLDAWWRLRAGVPNAVVGEYRSPGLWMQSVETSILERGGTVWLLFPPIDTHPDDVPDADAVLHVCDGQRWFEDEIVWNAGPRLGSCDDAYEYHGERVAMILHDERGVSDAVWTVRQGCRVDVLSTSSRVRLPTDESFERVELGVEITGYSRPDTSCVELHYLDVHGHLRTRRYGAIFSAGRVVAPQSDPRFPPDEIGGYPDVGNADDQHALARSGIAAARRLLRREPKLKTHN